MTSTTASSSHVKLSSKELAEYQEAFDFFDTAKHGCIQSADLGNVMRAVGLSPCESELEALLRATKGTRAVLFNEFLQLSSTSRQTREAFHAFVSFVSFGNGLANLQQMRLSLRSLGEKLGNEETDELIRDEADIDTEGNVNCEEIVKFLCRY